MRRAPAELRCPGCGTTHPDHERFCARCGLPLVLGAPGEEAAVSEPQERARKIQPSLAQGELVHVATVRHGSEAELLQGLLLEEGVPSVVRRTRGFDVPDFLAAGPRDVLVPAAGVELARAVVRDTGAGTPAATGTGPAVPHPARLAAVLLAGAGLAALVAWAVSSGPL